MIKKQDTPKESYGYGFHDPKRSGNVVITNERQYRITKSQITNLNNARKNFNIEDTTNRVGSARLAMIELEALKSEIEILSEQLSDYEALKLGSVNIFKANSLQELPMLLIQARITQGLSQRQLADKLNLKEQQIQRYEAEIYASAKIKRLAEIAEVLNLEITEIAELKKVTTDRKTVESKDIEWNRFPIKEMYLRNWFEGYSGSISAALNEAGNLAESFITNNIRNPSLALYRKHVRSGSQLNPYALLAWECRVLQLARLSVRSNTFNLKLLDEEWIRILVAQSKYPNGPVKAKEYLENAGIALIIEPHLQNTHLDGAAFLQKEGNPVIGLTLRYDRLDNFWFVLLHELFHLIKHLRKGDLENIFDDLEAESNEIESEADFLTAEALIPDRIWETALARYDRSEYSVNLLSEELGISPAIIAGRIRNEANNYVILNNLVGQGKVRRQFPNTNFGQ